MNNPSNANNGGSGPGLLEYALVLVMVAVVVIVMLLPLPKDVREKIKAMAEKVSKEMKA